MGIDHLWQSCALHYIVLTMLSSFAYMQAPRQTNRLTRTNTLMDNRINLKRIIRAASEKRANSMWPDGRIPFIIDNELESERIVIHRAMENFHENTCLRFVARTYEPSYLRLTKNQSCWSESVGYRVSGVVTVSLGDECYHRGLVVHELAHVVGLVHEHQRPDRGAYVSLLKDNVQSNMMDQFQVLNESQVQMHSSYDQHSVMHYPFNAFLTPGLPPNTPTLVLVQTRAQTSPPTLPQLTTKYGLSRKDIATINKLYNCSNR